MAANRRIRLMSQFATVNEAKCSAAVLPGARLQMGSDGRVAHNATAAAIDGAVGWRQLVYITLPLLGPTILTAAILRSVDLLRFFDVIYITTQGGPGYASSTLNIYAYRKGFEFSDIGYASALMITLSTIVFAAVLVFGQLRRKVTW